ncbi:MAG: hypothetical protein MZV64_73695 [Ignavibacteriales bacterium]|nr:hypothetical protein [Ignavibacteriales bacterium]
MKDDLSRYLHVAEREDVVITRHGKPAGVLDRLPVGRRLAGLQDRERPSIPCSRPAGPRKHQERDTGLELRNSANQAMQRPLNIRRTPSRC